MDYQSREYFSPDQLNQEPITQTVESMGIKSPEMPTLLANQEIQDELQNLRDPWLMARAYPLPPWAPVGLCGGVRVGGVCYKPVETLPNQKMRPSSADRYCTRRHGRWAIVVKEGIFRLRKCAIPEDNNVT